MTEARVPQSVAGFLGEVLAIARQPVLLVWSLMIFLLPFYVFNSGLPQPGDMLVLLLVPLALAGWSGRLVRECASPLRSLMFFVLWVVAVNYTWALVLGNFGVFGRDTFLLFPVYYIFNGLVFLSACVLYQRYGARFLWLTLHLVFVTALFQVAASFVFQRLHGFRGTGFFNNPNQLGFYALISASIIALGKRRLGFGVVKTSVGLTACLYLALLSASKAAVIGIGILFALTLIVNPRLLVVAAIAVFGMVSVGGPVKSAIEGTERRLAENRYPQYNFFEQRGYDRIYAHKEYWLLGAGEGGTSRFVDSTVIGSHEIHSSAGTIFFSYGLVGVALFLAFLARLLRGAAFRTSLLLVPPLTYTIAHQGLRASLLWILFAMFAALKHLQRET